MSNKRAQAINAHRSRRIVFFGGGFVHGVIAVLVGVLFSSTHPRASLALAAAIMVSWNVFSVLTVSDWVRSDHEHGDVAR